MRMIRLTPFFSNLLPEAQLREAIACRLGISDRIRPSMSDGYDCYQNALEERINGVLKQEFLLYLCKRFADLKVLVAQSIEIYNRMGSHLSLGMRTPESVHEEASPEAGLAE